METNHPAIAVAVTFAIGAAAGLSVLTGMASLQPEATAALFDLGRDGIGLTERLAAAWLFGQAAILLHHVLPGIADG